MYCSVFYGIVRWFHRRRGSVSFVVCILASPTYERRILFSSLEGLSALKYYIKVDGFTEWVCGLSAAYFLPGDVRWVKCALECVSLLRNVTCVVRPLCDLLVLYARSYSKFWKAVDVASKMFVCELYAVLGFSMCCCVFWVRIMLNIVCRHNA